MFVWMAKLWAKVTGTAKLQSQIDMIQAQNRSNMGVMAELLSPGKSLSDVDEMAAQAAAVEQVSIDVLVAQKRDLEVEIATRNAKANGLRSLAQAI